MPKKADMRHPVKNRVERRKRPETIRLIEYGL
jgi:hypothetical protein